MNYQCSENKGADQLRGYREADQRLCFRICEKPVFSRRGSHYCITRLLNVNAFNMQYVGQTNQHVSKRMNGHRFDIKNYDSQGYATNVTLHFNSDSHSITDFGFLHIDVVSNEMARLCKETHWIHKLETLHPKDMDSKLLNNV